MTSIFNIPSMCNPDTGMREKRHKIACDIGGMFKIFTQEQKMLHICNLRWMTR